MKIAVDFDGTIVTEDNAYDDLSTPLKFMPGAKHTLLSLRDAGHTLILYSGRANLSIRKDWRYDPWKSHLVETGKATNEDVVRWMMSYSLNEARYQQMLHFVERELPNVFAWIDDGQQGKVSADLFIDDRAMRFDGYLPGSNWQAVEAMYGAQQPARMKRLP